MSTGAILVAAAGSAVTFMLIAAFVLGVKWLARYFERQAQRDRAKAEAEGAAAAVRGELPQANPYLGERSDHFRGMAEAWNRGYGRALQGATQ